MTQEALFYESLNDALKEIMQVAGGAKSVSVLLWPEKSPDAARSRLLDCLNPDRPDKLSPDQVLLFLKIGRQKGCHAAMNYLARDAGYEDPKPVDPEDEKTKVQREFIEAQKYMSRLAARMERVGMMPGSA